jgi:hypothetical protein
LAKKKSHLSPIQIKIRILAFLYPREDGANSYTIQRKANIPSSQESNRFKGFLDDLCALACLEKKAVETGGDIQRINYIITKKGKDTVDLIRNPIL